MTHKSRAAERKAKPDPENHTAAAPIPIPAEPETVPVLPLPDIQEPSDSESEHPGFPVPSAAHDFRHRLEMVDGEDIEHFDFIRQILSVHYHPSTIHAHALVEDVARARWLVLRRERILNAIEAQTYKAEPDGSKWSESQFKRISLASQHLAQAERAYRTALENAYPLVRERIESYHWESTFEFNARRFEFEKRKLDLAVLQAQAEIRTKKAGAH